MKTRLLLSIIAAAVLVGCGGAEERKAVYMEKAKSSIESGDLDKARIELKNVLQIDPKDDEAYYQIGKVFEAKKDYRKAFANFTKAETLNPDNLPNQARLGRFYLLLANDVEKTQEKVDFILSKEPNNAEGLLLKAAVAAKGKKMSEAIDIVNGVVSQDPANIDAVTYLTSLYIQEKKDKEALAVLETAIALKPENESLQRLLAVVLIKTKDYEGAERIYKEMLAKYPDSMSSYNSLAVFYNTTGDKEKSEAILRQSVENNPDDISRHLLLAKYIKISKGNEATIEFLNESIKNYSGVSALQTALADLYFINKEKQKAIEAYEVAISKFSEEAAGIEARVSLASIYYNDKEYDKASKIVEEAIAISPNNPKINLIRARIAIGKEDTEKAIIALRSVIKETPEDIDAYFLLVHAYVLEKNEEQIRETLNTAHNNNKNNPAALYKLVQYYSSRDIGQAEKILDDYNALKKDDYEGLSLKGAMLNKNKKMDEAYEISKTLLELYPNKPNGYLLSVPYFNVQKDLVSAISTLERGYLAAENNTKILLMLTSLQVADQKYDVAKKRLQAEINAKPDDAGLKFLLAKIYLAQGDLKTAEVKLLEIVDLAPKMKDTYLLLSQVYANNKDMAAYKSILLKGKEQASDNFNISLKTAAFFESQKEYQDAIGIYKDMYKDDPTKLIVINNLASLISDHSKANDDIELMKTLVETLKKSNKPVFFDTIGWAYYVLGDYPEAIKNLLVVIEKAPDVNVFNYHLGMAYKMSGDKEKAKTYLEKSLADKKDFIEKDKAKAALKSL